MDKKRLIEQILAQLERERRACLEAAKAAQADATDEQSKAENKYDTRGLEASYLARGQALQTAELDQAIGLYAAWEPRLFLAGDVIGPGALVELDEQGERTWYFFGPASGGLEVTLDGQSAVIVTAQSPLARRLFGRRAGDILAGGSRVVSVA